MKINSIEDAFIHDVRTILAEQNTDSKVKVMKLHEIMWKYDTIKDIERFWPDSKELIEKVLADCEGGEKHE